MTEKIAGENPTAEKSESPHFTPAHNYWTDIQNHIYTAALYHAIMVKIIKTIRTINNTRLIGGHKHK